MIEPRFHRATALLLMGLFISVHGCANTTPETEEVDVFTYPPETDVLFQIPFVDDLGNPASDADDTTDTSDTEDVADALSPEDVQVDVAPDITEDAPDVPPTDPCDSINCDDNNVCTEDTCVAPGDCVYVDAPGACDDGNPCTHSDECSGSSCQGQTLDCDDGNECTNEICLTTMGCSHAPTGGECSQGSGTCVDGVCSSYTCPDGTASPCAGRTVLEGDATLVNGGDLLSLHGYSIINGNLKVMQGMTQITLPNLEAVSGDLLVINTTSLSKIELPLLKSIDGAITVTGNMALGELLAPALTGSTGEVLIQDNPVLPQCLALAMLTQIQSPLATINGNCADCDPCE